jgi:hypothetical protein
MMIIQHKFVEFIPDIVEEKTLYISIEYCTAVHKCVCGCGNEVVTPISPTDWKLIFEGKAVSLYPSIGNWSFDCMSHYWIKRNSVIFAKKWCDIEIDKGRKKGRQGKIRYFKKKK